MDEQPDQKAADHLTVPPPEVLRDIAAKQDAAQRELLAKKGSQWKQSSTRDDAARLIQKNYRGYRARRELDGYALESSTRWVELLKEAKYLNSTRPRSNRERTISSPSPTNRTRERWQRLGIIAHRAGSDDTSTDSDVATMDEEHRAVLREKKRLQKEEREKYAQVMGLEYFLEMVDQKHRYGSNLRRYHVEWKKSETNENFFYWLDYGEGKDLDLGDRPRSRLDTERVRYLSREERQNYLVRIDKQGRFCWAKNDQLITTSQHFKDSIDGIVPIDDHTPTWREVTTGIAPEPPPPGSSSSSSSSVLSAISTGSQEDESKYANTELHDAKGVDKVNHVSADALMNHLLRKTTKKNTWIFACDTSFRLYMGIKQSGAFQHSSFFRGARVAAAGLIKVKRGQVRKLSPLSGHYAPPLRNFREFVKSLKEEGADLSRLNLSRSYAVLLGLESYIGAKKHVKTAEQGVKDMIDPESKRKREEAARDKSKSAQREREILDQQERERRKRSLSYRFKKRLGLKDGDGVPGT
ncbi:hypothetical protein LTR37_006346 [Vermiconidia calcicola]|uniref:Uncharacterized protein n=1 Tax=Vermiconidia calcicola TaxID=1690605 RepID=A0ACC3NGT1_9PEZI|nr:hypothetical protein LTR37_006346 [Vermiconidia calcicola]